jgi:hypothetical protein
MDMSREKFNLDEKYINEIKGYGTDYRFSLESRLVGNGDSDYVDCETAKEVIKELKNFVADKDFNEQDYECLAVLIYAAHSEFADEDEDDWGEREAEYYFI